jgi:hypothetical protein
MPQATL